VRSERGGAGIRVRSERGTDGGRRRHGV